MKWIVDKTIGIDYFYRLFIIIVKKIMKIGQKLLNYKCPRKTCYKQTFNKGHWRKPAKIANQI